MSRPPKLWRWLSGLVLLGLALLVSAWIALGFGPSAATWSDLADLLAGDGDPATRSILMGVRLPRVLLAALVGAALAGAGAAFQAILRNPLADPFILGVSGGSALGAVLFTALVGTAGLGFWLGRPLAAFGGAVATLFVLFHLARIRGRTGTTTLLLVGVVLNAFDSAVILVLVTAGDPSRFQGVLYFLVGSIRSLPWSVLFVTCLLVALGALVLLLHAHRLNVLAFGEEVAGHLGVDVERTLWTVVIGASLITAAAVAFTGLVGFVGLIVPHAVRAVFGPDHRMLVPSSMLVGATLLILADTLARTLLAPVEMPVGVITTLVGGPFFLFLFLRRLRVEG